MSSKFRSGIRWKPESSTATLTRLPSTPAICIARHASPTPMSCTLERSIARRDMYGQVNALLFQPGTPTLDSAVRRVTKSVG